MDTQGQSLSKDWKKNLEYVEHYMYNQLPRRAEMDNWCVSNTEDLLRIVLDSVYKEPIYSIGLVHTIDMFQGVNEVQLELAIKLCMLLDIAGVGIAQDLDERSWARREKELLLQSTTIFDIIPSQFSITTSV